MRKRILPEIKTFEDAGGYVPRDDDARTLNVNRASVMKVRRNTNCGELYLLFSPISRVDRRGKLLRIGRE